MADRDPLKLRRLPDGEFRQGLQAGWTGCVLDIELAGSTGEFSIADLLEIECGSVLYFGELQQWKGSVAAVLIEHKLDRAALPVIQEAWR